jgi:hypothetical protein
LTPYCITPTCFVSQLHIPVKIGIFCGILTEFLFGPNFSPLGRNIPGKRKAMFSSPQHVLEALASAGYITDAITATVVHLAARLNKPVLLEGPPGSGKTELAYSRARDRLVYIDAG